jgi:hypothetical protein
MQKRSDILIALLKSTGIILACGSYHLYSTEELWKLNNKIQKLQEKQQQTNKILESIERRRWW